MFYSASCTRRRTQDPTRFERSDRIVALVLVVAIALLTPLSAMAGNEFEDANNAVYDNSVVSLDNTLAGETNFTIDADRTVIEWQDFQQPASNALDFHFSDTNSNSAVLNRIGAQSASNVFGTITSNGTVVLANPFGVFVREGAVIDVGHFAAIAGNVSAQGFLDAQQMAIPLLGTVGIETGGLIRAEGNIALLGLRVVNDGVVRAENGSVLAVGGQSLSVDDWDALTADFLAPKNFYGFLTGGDVENGGTIQAGNAALFGNRIANMGEIEVDDGTLLMVAGDAVWVSKFDHPVLVKVPDQNPSAWPSDPADDDDDVRYAIENHGRLDAGLGHVRLAASDPLGFAIRQGTGRPDAPAAIVAKRVYLEGGRGDAAGRVHLSGEIDASDAGAGGVGGEINVTGSMIVLEGANLHASGADGGGTIHVGGEREGRGELERARLVLVDAESQVRADALHSGDGGEVIVFAEDLTSVDGALSARGGDDAGDGGFVETSGLRNFLISRTPDVTAPRGRAGDWLIDPFNITIDDTLPGANSNLNNAIAAILSPSFDSAGFDGILRTVNETTMDMNGVTANLVSAELIANALAAGTSVTLSTQAFGIDRGADAGHINILSDILIDSTDTIEGTTASLTLLAAGDINVESDIMAFMTVGDPVNFALDVSLLANDAGQVESDQDFEASVLNGNINLNADIRTGGGTVALSGSSVIQAAGQIIDTDGGAVDVRSGTIDAFGRPMRVVRDSTDPLLDPMTTPDPTLEIAGTINTCASALCDGSEVGGDVALVANSINVLTRRAGPDAEQVVSGQLNLTGTITTEGGNVDLAGGALAAVNSLNFAGNVDIDGDIDSGGGDVSILSNHVDPDGETGNLEVSFLREGPMAPADLEGGVIDIDANITTEGGTLSIGGERTQSIQLDGDFDTTQLADTTENGLVQIVANDLGAVVVDDLEFGLGEISIGVSTDTTIASSSLILASREITFSDGAGANAVALSASGSSTAALPNLSSEVAAGTVDAVEPTRGAVTITGDRQLTFNENTTVSAESIEIVAASRPAELNTTNPAGDERPNSETRVTFGGVGGADETLGVRLSADSIMISIGDGSTTTDDGFLADTGTSGAPEDFGLERMTRGRYAGLQLRDSTDSEFPSTLAISQDGDLTLISSAPVADGQLDLVGAFGDASVVGASEMEVTLESSDGVLVVEDAVGLNNRVGAMPADVLDSTVVLNGGLFLPVSPNVPTVADDSVRFRDGTALLGADGTAAFDVESLTVSSAGDFTVRQQILDGIDAANLPDTLIFEAGRDTGTPMTVGRGTLTIDPGLAIQSGDRLALRAGGTGFGDLAFSAGAGTTVAANDIELRAGAGESSQNDDSSARSSITGLQSNNVTIRDARFASIGNAAIFGDDLTSTATSFRFQQDATIDGQVDLPDLAQFGLSAAGFRAEGDIEYKVRSDEGQLDLDDGDAMTNELARFQNAFLSLIGVDSNANPAVDVSDEFSFVGKRVELGGIGDFTFDQTLASVFNRSGLDADEEITLRAGVAGLGDLEFDRGNQSEVIVKAPRINLIVGDGAEVDDEGLLLGESSINANRAQFDLAGPMGSTPTFAFNTSSFFVASDLPDVDQFMTETAPGVFTPLLPDVLAIRTDLGILDLQGFNATALPLDLIDDPGRLILEAEEISLSQTDGDDLALTSIANLNLRLRTNDLTLTASTGNTGTLAQGEVQLGPRVGDNPQPNMALADASFDNESLLIEAFDRDARSPTVTNLSTLSEDTPGSGLFTLANGRGPTSITLLQDAAIIPGNLFDRDAVAGQLTRTLEDDVDDTPIATLYSMTSLGNSVTFEPDNVNGSTLTVVGAVDIATDSAINFGSAGMPGSFFFESVFASTESSIIVQDGTEITAADTISLVAGLLEIDAEDPGTLFGSVVFTDGAGMSRLAANKVALSAGPAFKLDAPDADDDGEPDEIDDADLPRVDLTGLDEIERTGSLDGSQLTITQSADLDSARMGTGDFLTPVEAGLVSGSWETLTLSLTQGDLTLGELDAIAAVADNLVAQTVENDAQIAVTVPDGVDPMTPVTPFDDFVGTVEFESNDVLIQSMDANTSISLDTEKLVFVSSSPFDGTESAAELDVLRDEADSETTDRPILRIHQNVDFTDSELPRLNQYLVANVLGERSNRSDLSELDIELRTLDLGPPTANITLDDQIRSRTTTANLILDSAADVDIMLVDGTPGFDGLAFADLQLNSLDVKAAGDINVRPFMSGGGPANLTIETAGDQRFDGNIVLENTLSTRGRDIRFMGDVTQSATPTAGLLVGTSGKVVFEGDLGATGAELDRLVVTFDSESDSGTPNVEFGTRSDGNGDGVFTPDFSNQTIAVTNDIVFAAYDFEDGDRTGEIETALGTTATLADVASTLSTLGLGRTAAAAFATIGKGNGDLSISSTNGRFIMASGEKLSVAGLATIDVDDGLAAIGDVSAIGLSVVADLIGLVRRASGVVFGRSGSTRQDGGPSIVGNSIAFVDNTMADVTPVQIGSGRGFRFGLPNPFDASAVPTTLDGFALFEIKPNASPLVVEDFAFISTMGELANQIPSPRPTGASRSDLSDAFGPKVEPVPSRIRTEPVEAADTDRLLELAVDAQATPTKVLLARLRGAAVIDDLDRGPDDEFVTVTNARIDAADAESAIALYEQLFGKSGERADEIREVLQSALDLYLENSRARRVVGFELRRFVKNRPSTLLDAYTTLDSLDALFQYHRHLGLSPGEYRKIQKNWLRQIKPDGISLDELSEAIHPSRYVRGSDILDIFGR